MNLYTVAWHDVDGFWMPCVDEDGQILAAESKNDAEKLLQSHKEYLQTTLAGRLVQRLVVPKKLFGPKYTEDVVHTWTGNIAEIRRRELRTATLKKAKLAI
ncbi:hypothetical protein [Serratia phage SP1]|nr:hypothetical protein [Serratia phage SP1]